MHLVWFIDKNRKNQEEEALIQFKLHQKTTPIPKNTTNQTQQGNSTNSLVTNTSKGNTNKVVIVPNSNKVAAAVNNNPNIVRKRKIENIPKKDDICNESDNKSDVNVNVNNDLSKESVDNVSKVSKLLPYGYSDSEDEDA